MPILSLALIAWMVSVDLGRMNAVRLVVLVLGLGGSDSFVWNAFHVAS
jgi:hypothetical protein